MNRIGINNGRITLNGMQIEGVTELTISPIGMKPCEDATHVVVSMTLVAETAKPTPAATDAEKLNEAQRSFDRAGYKALRDLGVGEADMVGLFRGLKYVTSQGAAKAQRVLDLFLAGHENTVKCLEECGEGSECERQAALDNYLRRTKALLDEYRG